MPQNQFTTADGETWAEPTLEELAEGHPVREAVEEALEAWHPNYVTDSGRINGYDDWVERVEGIDFPGHPGVRMDIGSDFSEHPFKTIKKIAKALAKDLA